jgi:hypothetical protein
MVAKFICFWTESAAVYIAKASSLSPRTPVPQRIPNRYVDF